MNKYTSFLLLSLLVTVIRHLVFGVNLFEHVLLPLLKTRTNGLQLEIQLFLPYSVFP